MSVIRAYILRAASPAVFFSLVTNLWVFGSTWGLLLITRKLLVGRSASLQQFLEAAAVCLLPAVGVYYFRQLTLPTFVDLHGNDYGISFAFVLGNFAGLSFTSLLTLDPSKYSLTLSKGKSLRNQIALIVTSAAFAVFTTFRLPDPELILAIMQMAVSIALPFELAMTSVLLNIYVVGFTLLSGAVPMASFTLGEDLGVMYLMQSIITGPALSGVFSAYGAHRVALAFQTLRGHRRFLFKAFQNTPEPLLVLSARTKAPVLMTNVLAAKLGYASEDLVTTAMPQIYRDTGLARFGAEVEGWQELEALKSCSVTLTHKDGTAGEFEGLISLAMGGGGTDSLYIVALRAKPKSAGVLLSQTADVRATASHDTDSDSVSGALDEIAEKVEEAGPYAVMLATVNDYEELALSLSTERLSQLWSQMVLRAKNLIRATDILSEATPGTLILLLQGADTRALEHMALRVHEAFSAPFPVGDASKMTVQLNIGTSLAAEFLTDSKTAAYQASVALQRAKKLGAGQTVMFDAAFNANIHQKNELVTQMADAKFETDFAVYYQPRVSADTGKIIGCEALLRWTPPTGPAKDAAAFIRDGLNPGQLRHLSARVRATACVQMQEWLEQRFPLATISVNVSPMELWHDSFHASVQEALSLAKLDGSHLELEIDQSAITRAPFDAQVRIKRLQALNVRLTLAVQGFGPDLLALARKYGITRIKFSKEMIQAGLLDDAHREALSYIMKAAQTLRFSITAEGVESQEQAQEISEMPADTLQGYYFGAPVPPEFLQSALQSTKEKVRLVAVK